MLVFFFFFNSVPLPVVTAILSSQVIFAGSSLNVTCVAQFDDTVDAPLIIDIMCASSGDIIEPDHSVQMESYTQYTRTFTIENIKKSQEYTCAFMPPYSELSAMYILMPQNGLISASVNVSISEYS